MKELDYPYILGKDVRDAKKTSMCAKIKSSSLWALVPFLYYEVVQIIQNLLHGEMLLLLHGPSILLLYGTGNIILLCLSIVGEKVDNRKSQKHLHQLETILQKEEVSISLTNLENLVCKNEEFYLEENWKPFEDYFYGLDNENKIFVLKQIRAYIQKEKGKKVLQEKLYLLEENDYEEENLPVVKTLKLK